MHDFAPSMPWAGSLLELLCLAGAFRAAKRRCLVDNLPTSKTTGVFIGLVELKRRHDLIPNLVEVVGGYADYERQLQTELAALRTELAATPPGVAGPDYSAIAGVVAVIAERYPELKANQPLVPLFQLVNSGKAMEIWVANDLPEALAGGQVEWTVAAVEAGAQAEVV